SVTENEAAPEFLWIGSYQYRSCQPNNNAEYYVKARHYNSSQGRWNSVDPVWPKETAYVYASGVPTRLIDPTGLWWINIDCPPHFSDIVSKFNDPKWLCPNDPRPGFCPGSTALDSFIACVSENSPAGECIRKHSVRRGPGPTSFAI